MRRRPKTARVQAAQALRRAHEVKRDRAKVKAELASGERHVADLLMAPPPCVYSALVVAMLRATYGVGERKAVRVMRRAGISELLPVADLDLAGRDRILDTLRLEHPWLWSRWQRLSADGGVLQEQRA